MDTCTENTTSFTPPSHDEIARYAYEIWQSEGCRRGCAMAHWLLAEQLLTAEARAQARLAQRSQVMRRARAVPSRARPRETINPSPRRSHQAA